MTDMYYVDTQTAPVLSMPDIEADIGKKWDRALAHRLQYVEERLLRCLRARKGEYSPQKLSEIRKYGGSEIYMMVTAAKCRGAESWIKDVLLNSGDRSYSVSPTPIADVPNNIKKQIEREINLQLARNPIPMQDLQAKLDEVKVKALEMVRDDADKAADAMAQRIDDQLEEGGWRVEFDKFISDFVTFPYAVMKGPVLEKVQRKKWSKKGPVMTEDTIPVFKWVSAFDLYMSPEASSTMDGYLFERARFVRNDLFEMIGLDGFDEDSIRQVLSEQERKLWLPSDTLRGDLEDKTTFAEAEAYECKIYCGPMRGSLLNEYGVHHEYGGKTECEPDVDYEILAWVVNSKLIGLRMIDPVEGRPYHRACFEHMPGAFLGVGLPERLQYIQSACNGAARALMNNMGVASGPQVMVMNDRLADGEKITSMYPWKIWQAKSSNNGMKPIDFFQPSSNAQELLAVYDTFEKKADDISFPRYAYGDGSAAGAGRTSSGLAMLMSNASKVIKESIANIDIYIVEPIITALADFNNVNDPDDSIKGDIRIKARGATDLMMKEQMQVRRNEFMQLTNNPGDLQIMGVEGRTELMRSAVKALDLDVDKVVPSESEIKEREAQAQAQQQQMQQAQMQARAQQSPMQQMPTPDAQQPPQNIYPSGQPMGGPQ